MKSTITSKFQTTIPKAIREGLKLSVNDTLDWELKDGKVTLKLVQNKFLAHRNAIRIGKGDISQDIAQARTAITEKYK
ncbi:type II toxin-antitoxin system PrlF family antitoxin [bacterium]|nr:type II toxin-antitoxin system PrlF family antitoxin [bacterium]